MSKQRKHVHKYHKIDAAGDLVWACALPNCSHFMPKHYSNMVIGKASICWHCGNEMVLDKDNMKNEQPICSECSSPIAASDIEKILAGKL